MSMPGGCAPTFWRAVDILPYVQEDECNQKSGAEQCDEHGARRSADVDGVGTAGDGSAISGPPILLAPQPEQPDDVLV